MPLLSHGRLAASTAKALYFLRPVLYGFGMARKHKAPQRELAIDGGFRLVGEMIPPPPATFRCPGCGQMTAAQVVLAWGEKYDLDKIG